MVIRVQPQRPSFKPIPYQRTSHRRGIPAWLIILTIGSAIGALGVLFLQPSYGPKRLSATEAQKLTDELSSSNIDRQRLRTELEELKAALDAVRINTPPSSGSPAPVSQ